MGKHIMIYTETCIPFVSQKVYALTLKGVQHTNTSYTKAQLFFLVCFSRFSFALVYTATLKRRLSLRPAMTLMENMSG